jgi:Helix-turn-helix domain
VDAVISGARALERAMNIKEVITRAISGQINWMQAAEIIGITDRSMRRWRKRLSTGGYEDLLGSADPRRPSAKRIDVGRLWRKS